MNLKGLITLFALCVSVSLAGNEILKVFHHRMNEHAQTHIPSLEVAKVTFYFSHDPIIKKSESSTKNSWHEIIFSIPGVKVNSSEILAQIQKLNIAAAKYYSLAASVDQSGLQLKVRYNPAQLVVRSQTTTSIKHEKVLEIVMYDKTLEQALAKKNTSVLRYTHRHKPTIIIDCGHGGHDTGTIGCFKTVEKEVTLAIGLKLKKELEQRHYPVLLTRLEDHFLPLDERTTCANSCKNKGLLISLHANHASKEAVCGLETYCLGAELYKPLDYQLATSMDIAIEKSAHARFSEGQNLAQSIHTHILKQASKNGYKLPDRHVKKATAQILSGLVFPGILVEMDFLSNPLSAQLLTNPEYQDKVIISGICNGLKEHIDLFSVPK